MNRPVIAAFVLLAFAGGLGVGYLMRGGGESAPEQVAEQPDQPRENSGRATGANEPSDSPGNGNSAAGGTTPDRGAGNQPEIKPSVIGDLGRAIAGIDAGEIPQGDGVITGKVTGPNGEPVEGVQVVATLSLRWRPDAGWRNADGYKPKPDLESVTQEQIRLAKREAISRRKGITGADGRYRIEELSDANYRISASAKGLKLIPVNSGRARATKAGAIVDFTAVELVGIRFLVLNPDGSVAADADISITETYGSRSRMDRWSPANPYVPLQPGWYKCRADSGEDEEYHSDEVDIFVNSGGDAAVVTLRLKAAGLRGKVKAPPGGYYDNLEIYLTPYRGNQAPDLSAMRARGAGDTAWQERGYPYEFWDLTPGRYLLAAVQNNQIMGKMSVDVVDGQIVQDLVIPALERQDYLVVRVYGPDDQPVKKAVFYLGDYDVIGPFYGDYDPIEREDGVFWIEYPEGLTGKAAHSIGVKVEGVGKRTVEYTRGPDAEVEVRFGAPAFVAVTVTGYEGSELEGELYLILARYRDSDMWFRGQVKKSDGKGTFNIGPLEPGPCGIVICIPTDGRGGLELATLTLTVVSGENALTVPLPRLNRLTVSARSAKAGTTVIIESVSEETGADEPGSHRVSFTLTAKLGEDHFVTFRHVPAGLCRIKMNYTNSDGELVSGSMIIRIPEQSSVVFAPD